MNEDKPKDPVRAALHQAAQTNYGIASSARLILRYENLNPEQRLAYVLSALVEHQKGTLLLMQTVHMVAAECVEWKKAQKEKPA